MPIGRIFAVCCIWLASTGLEAQAPIIVGPEFFDSPVTPSVLRDPSQAWTLDTIRSQTYRDQFVPAGSPHLSFGADPCNFWLHFSVQNALPAPKTVLLRLNRKNLDAFRLYLEKPDGSTIPMGEVGVRVQKDLRFFLMDGYYYALTLPPGNNQFWAETNNQIGSMYLGLSLHSPESFAQTSRFLVWLFGLFCGVVLLSVTFGILLLSQYRDRVYLFYIIYVLNLFGWEAYNYSADFGLMPYFQRNAASVLIASTLGMFFREFFRLWEHHKWLDRVLKIFIIANTVAALAIWQLAVFHKGSILQHIFPVLEGVRLVFTLIALAATLLYFKSSVRARILAVAYLPLAFAFSAILLRNLDLMPNYPIINQAVILGFVLEIILLTIGFMYWHRYLENERGVLELRLDVERKEKLLAVQVAEQRIKDRVARDLHDDVAASMSSIRILSEVAHQHISRQVPEAALLLEKISLSAQSAVEGLSDLIWAVKPTTDYLNDMADRMREYALKVLEAKGLESHINIARNLPFLKLNIQQRRNLYLIFKEAVINAVKYCEGSRVDIIFRLEDNGLLLLQIADDGIGFDCTKQTAGNGLENMRRRAREIDADLHIQSEAGKGTVILLLVHLTETAGEV